MWSTRSYFMFFSVHLDVWIRFPWLILIPCICFFPVVDYPGIRAKHLLLVLFSFIYSGYTHFLDTYFDIHAHFMYFNNLTIYVLDIFSKIILLKATQIRNHMTVALNDSPFSVFFFFVEPYLSIFFTTNECIDNLDFVLNFCKKRSD